MCRVIIFLLVFLLSPFSYSEIETDLGEPLSKEKIKTFDITVYSDGRNLPDGSGSPQEGYELYEQQCQMCHGQKGIEGPAARLVGKDGWFEWSDPLRILRINEYPILLISVGGMWPNATSLFDYIRRAMPHYAPKSLSDNEVYALTAYLLYLNGMISRESLLDKHTIMDIEMPGKSRSVFDKDYGFNSKFK